VFPTTFTLEIDGREVLAGTDSRGSRTAAVPEGTYRLTLSAPGYSPRVIALQVDADLTVEAKLEREGSRLQLLDAIDTGPQPKSVAYTPDGAYIVVALLEGKGVDVMWSDVLARVTTASPPEPWASRRGFVETIFFPARGEMWVSQMTTGMIHVFSLRDFSWIKEFSAGGEYPKVIARSDDESTAYVANWSSGTVSVIDVESCAVKALIRVGGTPRGIAVSRDSRFLYVCMFDSGAVKKIDAASGAVVKTLDFGQGAMRHIVRAPGSDTLFISDMLRGRVLAIDSVTDRLIGQVAVDRNLNTIALTPDGAALFVSSRGPNNPVDYTLKGPEFGKVYRVDTSSLAVTDWTWGGNQPTGLAVSPDGGSFAFSDFLDDRLELYRILPP
jgi:YVTN family beta-propeller protein